MARSLELKMLDSYQAINDTFSDAMKQYFRNNDNTPLEILEAGCGSKWGLDLADVEFTLTGVDISERNLDIRKNQKNDLDVTIVGDLHSVSIKENSYDIIYSSYVLEHIDGAQHVLDNFVKWVKPGGLIILRIPDRNTCFGFYTRITPLWVHVFYKKYVVGNKSAGTPGYGPYPAFYDKVISRKGIRTYCATQGLVLQAEYGTGGYLKRASLLANLANALGWITHIASLGTLAANHGGLALIIKKP